MRLTDDVLQQLSMTPSEAQAWVKRMSRLAVEEPLTVCVNGPRKLKVRVRTKGRTASSTTMHSFVGDEQFTLNGVFYERGANADEIAVALVPVNVALLQQIAGVNMGLSEACEHFDGLEAWVRKLQPAGSLPAKRKDERVPTLEETISGEEWGSW